MCGYRLRLEKKKKPTPKPKREKISYTKIIISAVMVTYFVGLAVGLYITFGDASQLSALLTYIATPVSVAIAFYCWKSKAENVVKIRRSLNTEALKLKKQLDKLPPEQRAAYEEIRADVDTALSELEV